MMTCVKGGKFLSRSEVGYTPLDFPRQVTATKVQSVSPILDVLHANEEGREGRANSAENAFLWSSPLYGSHLRETSPILSYLSRDSSDACGVRIQGFPLH